MKNVLEVITKQKQDFDGGGKVSSWLQDKSETIRTYKPQVPQNTPANYTQLGYMPPTQQYAPFQANAVQQQHNPHDIMMTLKAPSNLHTAGHDNKISDTDLFSKALRESRLPAPQILTFDGDPKRYKMFIASFMSNVDAMLDASDHQMKLTLHRKRSQLNRRLRHPLTRTRLRKGA